MESPRLALIYFQGQTKTYMYLKESPPSASIFPLSSKLKDVVRLV